MNISGFKASPAGVFIFVGTICHACVPDARRCSFVFPHTSPLRQLRRPSLQNSAVPLDDNDVAPSPLRPIIPYNCPPTHEESLNDKQAAGDFDLYLEDGRTNEDLSLDELRRSSYDAMAPFHVGKERMRPWVLEAFAPNLSPGDSIYESACGQGLNLLLTAEILAEDASIFPITVYGNDYLDSSVRIANRIWSTEEVAGIARKGRFCAGDSTNLDHVPPDSFDLVFCGYIAPLFDPLNLLPESKSMQEKVYNSFRYCGSTDSREQGICKLEQKRQEEWFARWVSEMVRIAKPGKVIAVEMNAESLCKSGGDFGGVDKEWWTGAVSEYNWGVDPTSIMIRDVVSMPGWPGDRYHVMMRKNR